MKTILGILTVLTLSVSSSFAGCGKTETDEGKLKSIDLEKKEVVITVKGKDVKRTLTPSSTGAAEAASLKGKKVTVVSSHGKVESIKG